MLLRLDEVCGPLPRYFGSYCQHSLPMLWLRPDLFDLLATKKPNPDLVDLLQIEVRA